MAISVCEVSLTDTALTAEPEASDPQAGALVEFRGVVRLTEGDAQIEGIEYEAHRSMAEHQLRAIANEAAARFDLLQVTIIHRLGFVPVGDASLYLRVTSAHRAAAFEASQFIVDQLKQRVPIWKHPVFRRGSNDGSAAIARRAISPLASVS
ncbi:MAG: molybdenum cofactor biosynthesis protein MoaE [Chthoniobacterales bacterium]